MQVGMPFYIISPPKLIMHNAIVVHFINFLGQPSDRKLLELASLLTQWHIWNSHSWNINGNHLIKGTNFQISSIVCQISLIKMADPCHITSGQLKVRMLTSINIQWITEPRYLQKINFKKKSQKLLLRAIGYTKWNPVWIFCMTVWAPEVKSEFSHGSNNIYKFIEKKTKLHKCPQKSYSTNCIQAFHP